MQRKSKALTVITNIIFYPVIIGVAAVVVLFLCGVKPYITMSGSMEPVIHTGSICFINTNAKYEDIRAGDIIAYRTATDTLVTHRAISISTEGIETKGDSNDNSDGISTTSANFHGKTLFSVPYLGYILTYLKRPRMIAIPFILLAGSLILVFLDPDKGKQESEGKQTEKKQ